MLLSHGNVLHEGFVCHFLYFYQPVAAAPACSKKAEVGRLRQRSNVSRRAGVRSGEAWVRMVGGAQQ